MGGRRAATPLFIIFAANAFALLGLRALYFLVTGLLDRLVYLSTGLSVILFFIGVKLLLHFRSPAQRRHPRADDGDLTRRDPRRADDHGHRIGAQVP